METIIYFNWTLQLALIVSLQLIHSTAEDSCIVTIIGGKIKKYGNCQVGDLSEAIQAFYEQRVIVLARPETKSLFLKTSMRGRKLKNEVNILVQFIKLEQRLDLKRRSLPSTCNEIRRRNSSAKDGLYQLSYGKHAFQTYCDMKIAGGGWTLVASIHENNMTGRCTTGDRWSSEHGNNESHPHGDGFWENNATYGNVDSATNDEYKNPGYFNLNATDIMIWQVPNNATILSIDSRAILKFHTSNGFLSSYGGNLATLFRVHYPIRGGQYIKYTDNGPSVPIHWDVGSNDEITKLLGPETKKEVEAGYVQFRTINYENNAFALCPGVRIVNNSVNVEHVCIGSTSNNFGNDTERYCGDFAALDYPYGWGSNKTLINSVVMIFYK